jgi:hypothetical protein
MDQRSWPWSSEHVLRIVAMNGSAAAAIIVASAMVLQRSTLAEQLIPFNVAVAALVLAGYGNGNWILRGRRAVGLRCWALLTDTPGSVLGAASSGDAARASVGSGDLVARHDLSRFHRALCPLADGKSWPKASRYDHEAAGRRACGVCQP